MIQRVSLLKFSVLVLFAGMYFIACKKQDLKTTTTEDVNIVGYLDKNLDSFSLIKQILDRTENSAFLNAYGSYTFFAPTNYGVKTWLSSVGAANVESADINALKELVKFHLLGDTVTTGSFRDGKLPVPTMQGQFLITGVSYDAAVSNFSVNRQAFILKSNVRVGNGYIHVIDRVLVPAKLTIAQQLEAKPNYSIFVQAMKETGFYTLLNTVDPDTTKRWKTVVAESNQALAAAGFPTYASLKARYSKTSSPANANDSLHMYMAYHIVEGIKFLGDIIGNSSQLTLEPQEVISTQLIDGEVKVNEDVFNGVLERGVLLPRPSSDNSATNGVWHDASGHFMVKYRKPTAVFWDVAAFPEIMKQPAFYKKQTTLFSRQSEVDKPIKDIDWNYTGAANFLEYFYSTSSSISNFAYNNDVVTLPLGPPSRALWWEFTTPVIIKGRYKVWVCYRNRNVVISNVRVNGELMQRQVNFGEGRPAGSDAELESIGWKRYTEGGTFSARLVGIIDIKTTERHKFRLEPISGTNRDGAHLDMVHFIPVDEPQFLPRFKADGTPVFL